MNAPGLDPDFAALPYRDLGDVALARARELGASHADFRFERVRYQHLGVRDGVLQGAADTEDLGFAVRVIHRGAWGFAAGVVLTTEEAAAVAERAVAVAGVAAEHDHQPGRDRPRAGLRRRHLGLGVRRQPARGPDRREGRPAGRLDQAAARPRAPSQHATACAAAGAGEQVLRRPGRHPHHPAADPPAARTSRRWAPTSSPGCSTRWRSIAPPVGRGWEYLTDGSYDWDAELAEVPELLAEKLAAPTVEAGTYDLVIHPSNLWLTIHESIGHATELDRALGYEANYAGTSFATYDKLGTLQYGSPVMNVTGDRTVEHGLATIGYDDEGVETQAWDIVRDGVLVGYQLDRADGAPEAAS